MHILIAAALFLSAQEEDINLYEVLLREAQRVVFVSDTYCKSSIDFLHCAVGDEPCPCIEPGLCGRTSCGEVTEVSGNSGGDARAGHREPITPCGPAHSCVSFGIDCSCTAPAACPWIVCRPPGEADYGRAEWTEWNEYPSARLSPIEPGGESLEGETSFTLSDSFISFFLGLDTVSAPPSPIAVEPPETGAFHPEAAPRAPASGAFFSETVCSSPEANEACRDPSRICPCIFTGLCGMESCRPPGEVPSMDEEGGGEP